MPTGQFDTPSPNKLIQAYQRLANKAPATAVNKLAPSAVKTYLGTFQNAEPADANLSVVQLQGGATVRFIPKIGSVGSLTPGDVVKLEKSGSQTLTIIGKMVGNFIIATSVGNVTPPTAPASLHTTSTFETAANIAWTASTDFFGSGLRYNIFINGVFNQTTAVGAVIGQITGLKASTNYSCYVTATDGAGNTSGKSNTITITTTAPTGVPSGTLVTKTYKATSLRSYNYNGHLELDSWHNGLAYQGSDQAGGYNQMSLIFFDDAQMRADMAGSDPVGCSIGVTYAHWYNSSGGVAYLGFHGYHSIPSHSDWGAYEQGIYHVSNDVGHRINVNFGQTHAEHFASGSDRGISVGPAPGAYPDSFAKKYYGYTYGAGSHIPTVTLSWRTS